MYQKFIITQDGELRFGHVYLHRDLLHPGESCPYGGGVWKVDEARHAILQTHPNQLEQRGRQTHITPLPAPLA